MAEKKISELTAKGATVADTDLIVISEVDGASYVSKRVTGANIKALVTDANLVTSDITTNDVSTAKHGFVPKAPNNTTTFLRGDGTWAAPAGGGLTEFTEAETTATPNATVAVNSLTPVAGTTNADFAIVPKGTGAILADIPDNTATGGNKRGTNAIDLQTSRSAATQVASGNEAVLLGTLSRASGAASIALGNQATASDSYAFAASLATASGARSFAFGFNTTASGAGAICLGSNASSSSSASGDYSIVLGQSNVASAPTSTAIGGQSNVASGTYSYASGFQSNTFGLIARQSRGAYNTVSGDCQKSEFFLSVRTTGNTATTVTVNGGAAATTNQVILSNNAAYRFKGSIVGKQSGSTNVAAWDIDGFIVRGANAAATTLNVSNVTLVQNTPAWGTPTLAADTTNGGLRVQVIGAATTNIQWTCTIETTEVIYA